MTTPAVTIASRTESRWRCGVEHTSTPRAWPAGSWADDELERLRGDPLLTVVETDAAADPAAAGPGTQALSGPEILDAALRVLRGADAVEVGEFVRAMAEDPVIAGKVERAMEEAEAGETGPTRHAQLVAAIRSLETGNKAHWTKSGDARIDALEAITGLEDVSAGERDAAQKEALAAQGDDA